MPHRREPEYDPDAAERAESVETPELDLTDVPARTAFSRAILRLSVHMRDRAWLMREIEKPALPDSALYCDTVLALAKGDAPPDPDPIRYPELREIDPTDADAPTYGCRTCHDWRMVPNVRERWEGCPDCIEGRRIRNSGWFRKGWTPPPKNPAARRTRMVPFGKFDEE